MPATTICDAAKQLAIFAALLDPLSSCLRAHLRAALATRGLRDPSDAIYWLRTTETTSHQLTACLDDTESSSTTPGPTSTEHTAHSDNNQTGPDGCA